MQEKETRRTKRGNVRGKKVQKSIITNSKPADSSSKVIFDDPLLCAQFCRGYVDLPYMKDVQPEDIEDVSTQYVPLIAEERNADRVKRINIKGQNPFFMISLIEHKTQPEYNIAMQIFRYMVYIWEDFAKEEEKRQKGISKTKDFKYPMILPIVYYEGSEESWTAPLHFRDKLMFGEIFGEYVPDFRYYLVPIRKFSNEELLKKGDEMSLLMMINKVQTKEDIAALRKIPSYRLEEILKDTPPHVLKVIADVMMVLLLKENVPVNEAEEFVEKVREKKMGELFANLEHIDIQAERRNTARQRELTKKEKERAEKEKERADREKERAEKEKERADREKERADKAEGLADKEKMLGIQLFIHTCKRFSVPHEEILENLMEQYGVSSQEVENWLEKYWND